MQNQKYFTKEPTGYDIPLPILKFNPFTLHPQQYGCGFVHGMLLAFQRDSNVCYLVSKYSGFLERWKGFDWVCLGCWGMNSSIRTPRELV